MKTKFIASLLSLTVSTAYGDPIGADRARVIAQDFLVPGNVMTLVNTAQRNPSKAKRLDQSVAATPPYYVYSRGFGRGYVVVSGDDVLPEVLGYTDSGDFDADNLPPALKDMLLGYAQAVEDAQDNGLNNTKLRQVKATDARAATRVNIAPFVTSHWHQSSPYNDICPKRFDNGARAMTGCVATAASQILYYWRKDLPGTLQATTPTYGYGNARPEVSYPKGKPMRWEMMKDSYSNEPAEYKLNVAEFVYCVGTATWLTYADGTGTATSGNIEKIPNTFSSYFGMRGGNVHYRDSYTQEAWTQLLYDELAQGRPVMYTGVHPESGGHAVFIHGYQASSNKFYYNFGWGGQGDGYWTTSIEDGMNGFNAYQSALIGAYPKKWNMTGEIALPSNVFINEDTDYRVSIKNNSTIPQSGFYLFMATEPNAPLVKSNAKSSDTETVIPVGESKNISLSAKITSEKTYYVTVTDADMNVLDKKEVKGINATVELNSTAVEVYGSSETVAYGDNKFVKVYNNKANFGVTVSNASEFDFNGTARLELYESGDEGMTFALLKNVTKANSNVPAHGSATVQFTVSNIDNNKLYYVKCAESWGLGNINSPVVVPDNQVAYFVLTGSSDLAVSSYKDGVVEFKGHWDPSQYSSICSRSTYKAATSYDLTGVENLTDISEVNYPNPNALVYVPKGIKGTNAIDVSTNTMSELSLTAGNGFLPKSAFTCSKGIIRLNQKANRWYMLTVPFACNVPDGIIAREVKAHRTSATGITNNTENVKKLAAGRTYLVMTSSEENQLLTTGEEATKFEVLAALSEDVLDKSFVGAFAATVTPVGAKVIDGYASQDVQYFRSVAEGTPVEGMRGYFLDEKMGDKTTDFKLYSSTTLDPRYFTLGVQIQNLYNAYKMYGGEVSEEANRIMADTLAHAEAIFSDMTIQSSSAITKYINALEAFQEKYKEMKAEKGTEEDFTGLIKSPSFENNRMTGWEIGETKSPTINAANYTNVKANANLQFMTVGTDGTYLLQSQYIIRGETPEENDTLGVELFQKVTGLIPGYYRMKVLLASDEHMSVTAFAGDSTVTVSGHPFGRHYFSEAVIEDIYVDETGELTIGVHEGDWYKADNFRLVRTGDRPATRIESVEYKQEDALRVAVVSGTLRLVAANATNVNVYSINGMLVKKLVVDGSTSVPLPAGVYVINNQKVIVK